MQIISYWTQIVAFFTNISLQDLWHWWHPVNLQQSKIFLVLSDDSSWLFHSNIFKLLKVCRGLFCNGRFQPSKDFQWDHHRQVWNNPSFPFQSFFCSVYCVTVQLEYCRYSLPCTCSLKATWMNDSHVEITAWAQTQIWKPIISKYITVSTNVKEKLNDITKKVIKMEWDDVLGHLTNHILSGCNTADPKDGYIADCALHHRQKTEDMQKIDADIIVPKLPSEVQSVMSFFWRQSQCSISSPVCCPGRLPGICIPQSPPPLLLKWR